MLVIFLPVLFVILFLFRITYKESLFSEAEKNGKTELTLLKLKVLRTGPGPDKWCDELKRDGLDTYVLTKGRLVVCDTLTSSMEGTAIDEEKGPWSKFLMVSTSLETEFFLHKGIPLASIKEKISSLDKNLFFRIFPLCLFSYIFFLIAFYRLSRPLGVILSKVEKFKEDISFSESLRLFYRRDEWGAVEEALNKADLLLQKKILELQEENEKNSAILESISDDIIAVDRFESILFFNSKFENNFIQKRVGLEINKKIWHIFQGEVLEAFRTVLSNGETVSLKGINFPDGLKPDRFFNLTITPLKRSGTVIDGVLGVFYDVTDFKLMEQMRVDFVANVSHEIRTPLTSIKGFSQILQTQKDKVDASLQPFLEKIITNTERMISLFNDLLNLSVIESKNYLREEEINLLELMDVVEGNIKASYPEKTIRFNNKIDLHEIVGDPRLIEQVLLNLADNACKYGEGDIIVEVSSFENNTKALITFSDNGPGIPKEHLGRIFERFYRIDASRESLRGTGLGLSIVKQIISKHHGRIWAESEGEGLGATFFIELPLSLKN